MIKIDKVCECKKQKRKGEKKLCKNKREKKAKEVKNYTQALTELKCASLYELKEKWLKFKIEHGNTRDILNFRAKGITVKPRSVPPRFL